jgi:hypothetical protein
MSEGRSIVENIHALHGQACRDKFLSGSQYVKKEEVMSKKTIGVILIFLGVMLAIVSLAADVIGIGNGLGIGWKQILGAVVGVLVAFGGAWWGWGKRK